ncbi:MAG TPA: hybrid sensor histidine kinase/response regulator [Rhodocyclaceae bacterium]|nr:hybrid sensor histidine kinase/response regulator [Rhodocyclaceae bacterium]
MIPSSSIVLVVDDSESMRQVTEAQLRALGVYNILRAGNGADALRVLQSQRVDVVLSDWNMPIMNGLEFLKKVREDEKLSQIPFVMITAEADRVRIAESISCGVSDLLVKPYTAGRLGERIAKAMTRKTGKPGASDDATKAGAGMAIGIGKKVERPTILVVDDTPDNLHLLFQLFKDDYRVRTALNGAKALDICQSDNPPDLVLLDVMMPGMDGFEVARRMRQHQSSEHIPIIFVTAMTDDDSRLKGLGLGAVDFVTKPVNPDVLKPRVGNFLRYVELHKQLQADYDSMMEAARLRDDVEQITRHDLKGPLAGVIGMVQLLAEDESMPREEVLRNLRTVEETALQAINMINRSSELYKIETGRFQLNAQRVKIADISQRVAEISSRTFADKNVKVVVELNLSANETPPDAMGDAMLCYSLLQNLVKNACEASPENESVWLTLNPGNPILISVKNAGAVPKEIRERFFDKFVTHNKQGGTGLGTYSAKLLAEAQKGSLELVVSDADNTTLINLTLPKA